MISKDFCNTLQSTQTWTTTAMTKNNISHKHIRFPAGSLNLNIDFPPLLFASALSVHRKQKDKIFLFKNREKQAARFSHDQRIANGRNCDLYTKQFRSCRSEHIVCCTHSSFPVDHRCAAYISALYHHDILLYVLRQSCNADDGKKVLFRVKKHFWFWWCAWENEWSCLRDLTDHSFWSAQKKHDIEMISCWGKCSLFRRALLAMFVWLDLSRGSRAAEGSRSAAAVPGPTSGIAAALSVHRQSGLCSFLLDCRRKPYKQEYLWSRWNMRCRVFCPCPAHYIKRIGGYAAKTVICRSHDEFGA